MQKSSGLIDNIKKNEKTDGRKAQKAVIDSPQSQKPFIDATEIPQSYNKTRLTLIARDPHWIHAYWEIDDSAIESAKRELGEESSYTLRMYDVTLVDFNGTNANKFFDIDVGPAASNWYINIWSDSVTYCGEIGMRTPSGRFYSFARSNFVTTPRANSSGRSDLIWMEVKDNHKEEYFVNTERATKNNPRRSNAAREPLNSKNPSRRVYLTEDDIRAYYSRLFPILRKLISIRQKGRPEEAFILDRVLLEGLSGSQVMKRILLGASEELVLPGGASEFAKGASERIEEKRKFFFEIGTELVVYGRTEPDAEVRLGDKKIKLQRDGTFTLRFALPDGKIPLDFTARSPNKIDKRTIITEVERKKTSYS